MLKKFIAILFLFFTYIVISPIYISNIGKFFFFLFLVAIMLAFYKKIRSKFSYLIAILIILESSLAYFIDPMQTQLTHYIFEPAVWVYYFLLVGVISDFLHDLKKKDGYKPL